jgi:hypothetical protein
VGLVSLLGASGERCDEFIMHGIGSSQLSSCSWEIPGNSPPWAGFAPQFPEAEPTEETDGSSPRRGPDCA